MILPIENIQLEYGKRKTIWTLFNYDIRCLHLFLWGGYYCLFKMNYKKAQNIIGYVQIKINFAA